MKVNELAKQYGDREVNLEELEKILLPVKKSVYDLEDGDKYWIIWSDGKIEERIWRNGTEAFNRRKQGRVFLTEKEAKLKSTRETINEELRRYAELHNDEEIDWDDRYQTKYYIEYAYGYHNKFVFSSTGIVKNVNCVYFTENITLDEVVNHIGKKRLLKDWVGIDDELNQHNFRTVI